MTNAELSVLSGVPKGTIDHSFSARAGKRVDVNYSTFAPILCALIGAEDKETPCKEKDSGAEDNGPLVTEYLNRIQRMEALLEWRRRIIIFLVVMCCVLIDFILAMVAVDYMDSNMGFFWR